MKEIKNNLCKILHKNVGSNLFELATNIVVNLPYFALNLRQDSYAMV